MALRRTLYRRIGAPYMALRRTLYQRLDALYVALRHALYRRVGAPYMALRRTLYRRLGASPPNVLTHIRYFCIPTLCVETYNLYACTNTFADIFISLHTFSPT